MNLQQPANSRPDGLTAEELATVKFAVGQSVPRVEDPMLLRGMGRYTDDVSLPGQAYMVMVRSSVAHGTIRSIDMEAARKMPGVLAVYSSAEMKGYGTLKCIVALHQSRRYAVAQTAPRGACDRQSALCRRSGGVRRRRNRSASEGRGRSGHGRHRAAAGRDLGRSRRPRRARRRFTTTCRATSRSTFTTATPRRSMPPSPKRRMSHD